MRQARNNRNFGLDDSSKYGQFSLKEPYMHNLTRPIAGAVVACAAAPSCNVTTSAADVYPVKPVRAVMPMQPL